MMHATQPRHRQHLRIPPGRCSLMRRLGASFSKESCRRSLHNPFRRRIWSHTAVENLPPFVLDDKEAQQQAESYGRNGKEIHGGEDLAVILRNAARALTDLFEIQKIA
jgi:hypothetical protein